MVRELESYLALDETGVPAFLGFLLKYDPNFREYFSSELSGRQDYLWVWWIVHGRAQFPALCDILPRLDTVPGLKDLVECGPGLWTSGFLKILWQLRSDLQSQFDLKTSDGFKRFHLWFLRFFPEQKIDWDLIAGVFPRAVLTSLCQVDEESGLSPFQQEILEGHSSLRSLAKRSGFPLGEVFSDWWWAGAHSIFRLPPDLISGGAIESKIEDDLKGYQTLPADLRFTLKYNRDVSTYFEVTLKGRVDFLLDWWALSGRAAFNVFSESVPLNLGAVPDLKKSVEYGPGLVTSGFLSTLWLMREDLKGRFDLRARDGFLDFHAWFLRYFRELNLSWASVQEVFPQPVLNELLRPDSNGLGRFHKEIMSEHPALNDLASASGNGLLATFRTWWKIDGHMQYRLPAGLIDGIVVDSTASLRGGGNSKLVNKGVNLVGHLFGEFGLGEDARTMAMALSQAQVPFVALPAPVQLSTRENALELKQHESSTIQYRTSIISLPPPDIVVTTSRMGGELQDTYRIAYSPWELSGVPAGLSLVFDSVDEFWAPSRFVKHAFEQSGNKPVHLMPHAVTLNGYHPKNVRGRYGLREDQFVFYCSFDFNSTAARKNPQAVLDAFSIAFEGRKDVVLLVKTMNASRYPEAYRALQQSLGSARQVLFVDETLTKNDLMDLVGSLDCYVSLHRSEGFGRNIAEAMLLGKPVVVTGYGGNVDFNDATNSYLVQYREVALGEKDYFWGRGFTWADPDLDHVIDLMRHVAAHPEEAREVGRRGQETIESKFSVAAACMRVRQRLEELGVL